MVDPSLYIWRLGLRNLGRWGTVEGMDQPAKEVAPLEQLIEEGGDPHATRMQAHPLPHRPTAKELFEQRHKLWDLAPPEEDPEMLQLAAEATERRLTPRQQVQHFQQFYQCTPAPPTHRHQPTHSPIRGDFAPPRFGEPRRYLTDDRDHGTSARDHDRQHELIIYQAENGDWYVGVWPKGHRTGPVVRICTSGGAANSRSDLPNAIAAAYRAL